MGSQLDRIETKLDNHIVDAGEKHTELSNAIATLIANEKINYKTIREHDNVITTLVGLKNQGKGMLWIIGIGWALLTVAVPIVITLIFR